jgi:hypothetical protein
MTDEPDAADPFRVLDPIKDAPVAPAHGIAAVALSLALKYHDINTIKDGALYQQYKLEGRNLRDLHLDLVFETAIKMEAFLLASSERIAKIVVDAIAESVAEDEPPAERSDK